MRNYIGCSGFNYDNWKGKFYPEDIAKKKWLEYYAQYFDTVEINASFYHLPKEKTLDNWYERTPGNFRFTLKGSRFITHQKKLNDVTEPVNNFYRLASRLKGKLGCILWQLPGNQHVDLEKLKTFCQLLSRDFKNVLEFRHNSWFDEKVYQILQDNSVTLCIVSAPNNLETVFKKTNDLVYVRFHGRQEWYKYLYSEEEMKDWADELKSLNARQIYGYFNNDVGAHAPENARQLARLL
jgi:uncharacterized protein YecE (DUF72 family)